MEKCSMSCRFIQDELTVSWFIDESDEWGGNDFVKRFHFDKTNTERLLASFDRPCKEAGRLKDELDKRFGHNFYHVGLDQYCQENGIHYEWSESVDQPGGYYKSGKN